MAPSQTLTETAKLNIEVDGQDKLEKVTKETQRLAKEQGALAKAIDGVTGSSQKFFRESTLGSKVTIATVFNLVGAYTDLNDILSTVSTTFRGLLDAQSKFSGRENLSNLLNSIGAGDGAVRTLGLLRESITLNGQAIKQFGAVSVAELTRFQTELTRVNTILQLTPENLKKLCIVTGKQIGRA